MRHLEAYPLGTALVPEEALPRLCAGERPFLLDGAADADGLGRWSFGGCDPVALYRDRELEAPVSGRPPLPLVRLEQALARFAPAVAVGLLGYDLGRAIERIPAPGAVDDLEVAPIDLGFYDALYRFDRTTGQASILATGAAAADRLRRRLLRTPPPLPPVPLGPAAFETPRGEYLRRVERVREYLHAGDCYQVNLCHRLRARLPAAAALPLYLRLRALAPAPLGAYLELGPGTALLCNSPERLLRLDAAPGMVETRPIKGTRRRGADAAADRALAQELLQSAKDHAEHLMIVDLLRNDLGRVAAVGSVAVAGYARLLELPTVHHLVSTVRARLRPGVGLAAVLRALLPGGSITGAPKVRAMEIIDELEPVRRGPFYGALGWLTETEAELALCIRTALLRRGELLLSVGGGIVLDSTPEDEFRETEHKAAAFLRALG